MMTHDSSRPTDQSDSGSCLFGFAKNNNSKFKMMLGRNSSVKSFKTPVELKQANSEIGYPKEQQQLPSVPLAEDNVVQFLCDQPVSSITNNKTKTYKL